MPDAPLTTNAPRAHAWGGETQRSILRALADDIRTRAGFKVCAIEVARADGMLEFVAIVGSREGEETLLGQASPLSAMYPSLALGADYGAFTFVAAEWLTDEAGELLQEYGFIPEGDNIPDPDAWQPKDMLAARLVDDRGHLRGIVYLDEPLSGMRLTPAGFLELSNRLSLPLRAVLTAFEREDLSNRARVARAASESLRALSIRSGVKEFLEAAHPHLVAGLRADPLEVRLFAQLDDEDQVLAPGFRTDLDAVARRAWQRRTVVLVEPGDVWGDEELARGAGRRLSAYVASQGALALVCVPLGTADEPVGYLLLLRSDSRWTEVESLAAQSLGEDLGRAVQLAHAFEREQRLVSELQRVDARRTEFARTVSHELKNPLTVVVAHLEQLEESVLDPRQAASVEAIERAVFRLQGLLRDLSMISRELLEHAVRDSVDLSALLREVADHHRAVARGEGIELKARVSEPGLTVHGSASELSSVLHNLLSNAVKYSDPGGRVSLLLEARGDLVVLTCADEGIGISPEDKRRLFTDFFRSTNTEALRRPGTGLGLAIVRRIVSAHGGWIDVESALGRGTTFTVHLPAG